MKTNKLISRIYIISIIGLLIYLLLPQYGYSATKAIRVKVSPKTIALPGNNVDRVPLQYARIRSTDLRELLKGYDLSEQATIEKVYAVVQVGNKEPERVAVDDTYIIRFSDEDVTDEDIQSIDLTIKNDIPVVTESGEITVENYIEQAEVVQDEASTAEDTAAGTDIAVDTAEEGALVQDNTTIDEAADDEISADDDHGKGKKGKKDKKKD